MPINNLRNKIIGELMTTDIFDFIRQNTLPYQRLMTYYKCAMMEIETKFKVLDEQFSLQHDRNPIEGIKTRLKSPESLAGKLKRKGLPMTISAIEENIYDVAGIRIICSFPEDIYTLADCLLQQDDIRLIEKKDYIKNPKKSGYRSLHLIVEVPIFLENEKRLVKTEVQLRTIAMDFWASLDHKLQYKKDIAPEEAAEISQSLAECAETIAALDEKMEKIKNRIVTA